MVLMGKVVLLMPARAGMMSKPNTLQTTKGTVKFQLICLLPKYFTLMPHRDFLPRGLLGLIVAITGNFDGVTLFCCSKNSISLRIISKLLEMPNV